MDVNTNVHLPGESGPINNNLHNQQVIVVSNDTNKSSNLDKKGDFITKIFGRRQIEKEGATITRRLASITSTLYQVSALLFAIGYNILWAILFIIYKAKYPSSETCDALRGWDTAIIVFFFILAGINALFLIMFLFAKKDETVNKLVAYNNLKSSLTFIGYITILVGVTVSYSALNDPQICGESLADLNIAFIIIEWIVLGLSLCLIFCLCCCTLIIAKFTE